MTDYTPTTNEIRADFITLHTRNFDSYTVGRSLASEQEVYGDAFDRMIAEVEREAEARALEEAAVGIFVSPAEIDPGKRMAFHRGADAVYDALRARAAEYRKAVE